METTEQAIMKSDGIDPGRLADKGPLVTGMNAGSPPSGKEAAISLHHGGSNCAQSVVGVFARELGIDPEVAHLLATGLGGGLGRRQHLCGAVSGAVMALGAAFGSRHGSELDKKEDSYARTLKFVEAIEAEFGSLECRALLGVDMRTPGGKAEYKELGLGAKVCDRIIGRSVELVREQLSEAGL